jgi:hypothetical protein
MSKHDDAIAQALALGYTATEVADMVGITAGHVRRRMNEPGVVHATRVRRSEIAAQVTASLITAAKEAADVLQNIIEDELQTPAVRVRASTALLNEARAWKDADIEDRLIALEEAYRTR